MSVTGHLSLVREEPFTELLDVLWVESLDRGWFLEEVELVAA
jgi:hypothetical protein